MEKDTEEHNKKNKGAESKSPPKGVEETVSYETKKTEVAPQAKVEVAAKPVEITPKVEILAEEKRDEATSNVIQFPTQAKRGVTAIAVNGETTLGEDESVDSDDSKPRLRTGEDKSAEEANERAERRKRKSSMSDSSEMRALGTGEHAIAAEEFFTKPKKKAAVDRDDFGDLQSMNIVSNPESRQWMMGTIGIVVTALVAFGGYYYYQNHVMPQPVALGHAGPATPGQVRVPTSTPPNGVPVVVPTVDPVVDPVDPTTVPVVDPVDPTTVPVVDPIDPTTVPVVDPVDPTIVPVGDPVDPALEPIVEPVIEPVVEPSAVSYESLLAQAREARRPTASIPLYEQAIAVNPTGAEALSQLAYILVQRPGREAQERARDLSTRATASDPTSSLGWLVLGASQEMLGRRTEARAAYQSCIEQGTGRWVAECRASRR